MKPRSLKSKCRLNEWALLIASGVLFGTFKHTCLG